MKNLNHMNKLTPLLLCTMLSLTACTSAIDANGYSNDPWEGMNRNIYRFNKGVDTVLLKPVAQTYEFVFPKPVRTGVSNFFGNISDIGSLANAIFQLDGKATAGIAARVIDNTVFGLGGIFDVATPMGNPKIEKNFGSTLAHYGVQSGPYLVLPLLGPSTLRDGIGKIPDAYLSPISYIEKDSTRWSLIGLNAIQTRAAYLPIEKQLEGTTTDEYATIRDAWLQQRWAQLGTPVSASQQQGLDDVFGDDTPSNGKPTVEQQATQ